MTRLVAYVVPSTSGSGAGPGAGPGSWGGPDARVIRAHVASELPDYMVPSAVVVLDALPLTPNGKLDRRALPTPDFSALSAGAPPRNGREALLARLFGEALGLPVVGIDDSFFDLGGDSIASMALVALAATPASRSPRDVFGHRRLPPSPRRPAPNPRRMQRASDLVMDLPCDF